ncbi:hypothetical protein [Hymenobacter sp. 15J16-1T3B]|uniref:hypothetical protein n=1 Tax=Hymenobacter sp. 15J16-1T3B TaxID=2886941 RepID=UPI001D1192C7|nr:hypothetical protein [Hymenobacter sp. 15J16-1T3B]
MLTEPECETGYANAAKQSAKLGIASTNAPAGCFSRPVDQNPQLAESGGRGKAGNTTFGLCSESKTSSG